MRARHQTSTGRAEQGRAPRIARRPPDRPPARPPDGLNRRAQTTQSRAIGTGEAESGRG